MQRTINANNAQDMNVHEYRDITMKIKENGNRSMVLLMIAGRRKIKSLFKGNFFLINHS